MVCMEPSPVQGEVFSESPSKSFLCHIKVDYTAQQLKKMSVNAGRDLTAVYDTSGYLSKLMLTAYELDEIFHDTLRDVFEIDLTTGSNPSGTTFYHPGPVKQEDRVKAKAQTDYANRFVLY